MVGALGAPVAPVAAAEEEEAQLALKEVLKGLPTLSKGGLLLTPATPCTCKTRGSSILEPLTVLNSSSTFRSSSSSSP